jgi:polyisoprenoid-binding protein YceI
MSTIEITKGTIPAASYSADPSHSTAEFTVRHMKISTVRGLFLDFEASLEGGDQPRVTGAIRTGSAITHDETRDGHLKSPDFFDVERYPDITYVSDTVEPVGDSRFRVIGRLTIRGITREQDLEATVTGLNTDPWGNERIGLTLSGELRPAEFGVDWNQALEGGGKLLGEKVQISADISAVKAT